MKRKRHPIRNFFILILFAALVYLGYYVFNDTQLFIVDEIHIMGNIQVTESSIESQLGVETGIHYFKVDSYKLKERLQHHPWVKTCSVEKVFPNGLNIIIKERRPVIAVYYSESYLLVDEEMYVVEATLTPRSYIPVYGYELGNFHTGEQIKAMNWKLLRNTIDLVYFMNMKTFIGEPRIEIIDEEIYLVFSDIFNAKLGDGENMTHRFNEMYDIYNTVTGLSEKNNIINYEDVNGLINASHDGEATFRVFGE